MSHLRRPERRIPDLTIVVDSHERYAYRFAAQQVGTRVAPLACGDYGLELAGELVASVERKSLSDFVSSLTDGRLRFALGELAALPRAAVVVEERYSQLFKVDWVRPAVVLDGLAELQVRWPNVPIVFCENRSLAEEWTYRYLAAARVWAEEEAAATAQIEVGDGHVDGPPSPRSVGGLAAIARLDGVSESSARRRGALHCPSPDAPSGGVRRCDHLTTSLAFGGAREYFRPIGIPDGGFG
jgi:ERCC4 domain